MPTAHGMRRGVAIAIPKVVRRTLVTTYSTSRRKKDAIAGAAVAVGAIPAKNAAVASAG